MSTGPERLTDETDGHEESRSHPGFCHQCCTRWPCDYEDMREEIHRLTIRLTDQEHELIVARAELLRWQRMGGSGEE